MTTNDKTPAAGIRLSVAPDCSSFPALPSDANRPSPGFRQRRRKTSADYSTHIAERNTPQMIENNQSRYALLDTLRKLARMRFLGGRSFSSDIRTGAKRPPFAALLPRPGLAPASASINRKRGLVTALDDRRRPRQEQKSRRDAGATKSGVATRDAIVREIILNTGGQSTLQPAGQTMAESRLAAASTVETRTAKSKFGWWAIKDLNLGPLPCEGSALTTELIARTHFL
jgi:hypothetical protein